MKKLNEDIVISDPQLAQQYANGQTQLINHDKKINALQMQINKIEQTKVQIQKKMAEIEQKAAQNSGEEKSPDQQQTDQAAVAAQAAAAAAASQAGATSESLLVQVNESEDEEERLQMEIDQISDQMMLLKDPIEIAEMEDYLRTLVDRLKNLDMDQMEHEQDLEDLAYPDSLVDDQDYDLDQHLDLGEHPLDEADEEEPRFSGMGPTDYTDKRNWYQKPEARSDYKEPKSSRKPRPWSDAKLDKWDQFDKDIRDIEFEIKDVEEDIKYQMERFQSPDFEGAEGEIENFFGEIGFEASDILNSGGTDKEKLAALKKLGKENPTDLLDNYYYYYPEFDPSLEKPRKEAEKEVKKLQEKITKLKAKIKKKEEQQEKMGSPVYEKSYNPMSAENFYNLSEAYAEMEDEERNEDEYLDKDYLFYIKVNNEDNEFIGKIYKVRPDGDWFGKIKQGKDDSFEKISYEPEYDEIDIVKFLGDNYEKVEIIDQHEFNDYIENEDIEEGVIGGSDWTSNSAASR